MNLHKLKIKAEYFEAIRNGTKTFELRKNDRDYQVGDLITFKVLTDTGEYNSDLLFKITYILKDVPEYGLDKDYCILSLRRL